MKQLISKIQNSQCEKGEFLEETARTYEATILLVNSFNWQREREHIVISLTNPSITIQDEYGNYLKIATYYNGKFVLHYLNNKNKLYTLAISNISDSYPYLKGFFEDSVAFNTNHFKTYFAWWQNFLPHFKSNNFVYAYNRKNFIKYVVKTSGFSFLTSLLIIVMMIVFTNADTIVAVLIPTIIFFATIGGGINIWILIPYYRYTKKHILIMSRSSDTFYFGSTDNPLTKYDKKEIDFFKVIKQDYSKSPINSFVIVDIAIGGNKILSIPNSLVDEHVLINKLFQCKRIESNELPIL
jgi:hypothetical protein